MSSAKHSLIANSADMDRSMESSSHRGGAVPPAAGGSVRLFSLATPAGAPRSVLRPDAPLRRADPAVPAQDGVRQGIAYVDESHDESFLHCCTTGLSKALSFVPCCWPALPFGCVPVNENEEQVLMVFGKFYDTLRQPGMHYVSSAFASSCAPLLSRR